MIVPFLKSNGKYTLYNTYGDFAISKSPQKNDTINREFLEKFEYDFIDFFHEEFAIVKDDNKTFFIDKSNNNLTTQREYKSLKRFINGIAIVEIEENQHTLINKNGLELTRKFYCNIYLEYKNFYSATVINNRHIYDEVAEGIYAIESNYGILDATGFEIICPSDGNYSYQLMTNFIYLSEYNKCIGLVDYKTGIRIYQDEIKDFEWFDDFYEDRALAFTKNSYEYVIIDNNFKIVKVLGKHTSINLLKPLPVNYHWGREIHGSRYFRNGICPISFNNKCGFIDIDGNFVLRPTYDFLDFFYGDCAVVGKNLESKIKYSFINSQFEEITEFTYDEIMPFVKNLAIVRLNAKFGVIDSFGKIVLEIEYSKIEIVDGFIIVSKGDYDLNKNYRGLYGLYNLTIEKICPIIYDYLEVSNGDRVIIRRLSKYGIIDLNGNEIVKPIYENIEFENSNYFQVKFENKLFYIDSNGREFREK